MHAVLVPPSSAPLCDWRTTICHIPSARKSANRQGVPSGRLSSGKAFACLDRLLDEQRAGPAYLRMPAVAEVVADAIGQGTASDYLLHAWVVMPNHVHLLITPQVEVPALLRRLKGTSPRKATNCWGKRVGRSGRTRAMIVSCGMPTNSN